MKSFFAKTTFNFKLFRALGIRSCLLLINLATAIILSRVLGPEQYGIYLFAFAVMTIIGLPGQAGMPLIMTRDVSFNIVDNNWSKVLGIIIGTRYLIIGYSLFVGFCILFAYTFLLSEWLDPTESLTILWTAFLLPALIIITVTGASLRSLNYLVVGQLFETIIRPLIFLILILFIVYPFGIPIDAPGAMILHALGATLALIAALLFQRNILKPKTHGLNPEYEFKSIIIGLAPLTLVAGMQIILGKTDILMIRAMLSPAEVAFYQVALQWANLILLAQQAVLMVAGPKIARAWRQKNLFKLQKILTSSARFVFIVALPLSFLLIFFGEELISYTFGEEYIPALSALFVFIIGRTIQASYGAIINLSKVLGWENYMLKLLIISVFINIILNYFLIPEYGISGAAAASVIASFFWKTTLMFTIWKKLGLASFLIGGIKINKTETLTT